MFGLISFFIHKIRLELLRLAKRCNAHIITTDSTATQRPAAFYFGLIGSDVFCQVCFAAICSVSVLGLLWAAKQQQQGRRITFQGLSGILRTLYVELFNFYLTSSVSNKGKKRKETWDVLCCLIVFTYKRQVLQW